MLTRTAWYYPRPTRYVSCLQIAIEVMLPSQASKPTTANASWRECMTQDRHVLRTPTRLHLTNTSMEGERLQGRAALDKACHEAEAAACVC